MEQMQIKPDSARLSQLLERVQRGEIAIPLFQREYVWTNSQVTSFFDSILKGYPIGTLILWSPEKAQFKVYEEIEGVQVSEHTNPLYVLDGRQRVTTLLSAFTEGGNLACRFYIDLSSEPFRVISWNNAQLPSDPKFLPIGQALDPTLFIGFLDNLRQSKLSSDLKNEYETNAKRINKILSWYDIGYVMVKGGSINDAEQIFSRLNSKMTPVSTDYMVQALAYNPDNDYLFAKAITNIQDELGEYGLSGISRSLLLKCVYTYTSNTFVDGKAEDLLKDDVDLSAITDSLRNDLNLAAEFLSHDCGVIDKRLLPYSYQLIFTAIFFRYRPQATREERKLLKKWFFYTLYDATFTNSSLNDIRDYVKRFTKWCQDPTLLPIDFKSMVDVPSISDGFTLGSVRGAAFTLSLINLHRADITDVNYFDLYTIPSNISRSTGNVVCCFAKEDKARLTRVFRNSAFIDYFVGRPYFDLTKAELEEYHNNIETFLQHRSDKLLSLERQFVEELFADEDVTFVGITKPAKTIMELDSQMKQLLKWLLHNTNWYITTKLDIDRLHEVANLVAVQKFVFDQDSVRNYCISIGWSEETANVIYDAFVKAQSSPFETLGRISQEELINAMNSTK